MTVDNIRLHRLMSELCPSAIKDLRHFSPHPHKPKSWWQRVWGWFRA